MTSRSKFPGDTFWYVIPLNPEPWRVGPISVGRGKGGGVYPIVGRDQQLHNYQEAVRKELRRQRATMLTLDDPYQGFELTFMFHHVLERYQTASGRSAVDKPADLTNLVKATEDAIQGVLIPNDTLVFRQTNYLTRIVEGPAIPYVVIGVAQYMGANPNDFPEKVWDAIEVMMLEHRNTRTIVVELPEQDVF